MRVTKKGLLKQAEELFKQYQNKEIEGTLYHPIAYNEGLKELNFLRRCVINKKCCLSSYQAGFDLFRMNLEI